MLIEPTSVLNASAPTQFDGGGTSVAVIITTYNHARFLPDAISSIVAQTRPADEIIVVDDGSTDDPAAEAAKFPGVRLIRQDNRGCAAARNAGLRSATASHVVFLDADDRLLPVALAAGLARARARPDCAFVYGGFRAIAEDGRAAGPDRCYAIEGDGHLALLRENLIGMHATVLYRRDVLLAEGGFDEALRQGEDYDAYLRIARKYPIASYPTIVAEYRKHAQTMSVDSLSMLRSTLTVLDRHEARIAAGASERAALREGRANSRDYFASTLLAAARAQAGSAYAIKLLAQAITISPRGVARRMLPRGALRWLDRLRRRPPRAARAARTVDPQ